MVLPRTVLGIPEYFVSWDPWDSTPGGTIWDCPRYPGILSILGLIGLSAWWDYRGLLSISESMGGSPCLVGLPGTVSSVPGYLVPWGQAGTSWVCDAVGVLCIQGCPKLSWDNLWQYWTSLFPLKFINRPVRDDTGHCCQSDNVFDFKTPRMYLTESITLQYGSGKLK